MDCCDKAAVLKSLRRRHQIVCSVIAILLIGVGVAGTAPFGFLLMSPLFIIAICGLVDAFLPRVSWFFCVRDVRAILGWRKR